MKLYLARHCLTNYNEKQLCNGDPTVDVHLTPTGITQAKDLADSMKDIRIDHIFISEHTRTLQTAKIINAFHDVQLEVDPRLNDIRSGFEGKPFEEYVKALDAASNRWTAHFDGGESIQDVKTRAGNFVDFLRTQKYDSVLIVTSEWIIRAMLAPLQNLTNEEAWDLKIVQGGYLRIEL